MGKVDLAWWYDGIFSFNHTSSVIVWENEKKPATKQQVEMFKRARILASTIRL